MKSFYLNPSLDEQHNSGHSKQAESEERINRLEAKLSTSVTDITNIEPLWDKAISNISQLDVLYENGTVTQKRKIIGSMFPENLTFDGFQHRTTRINEALNLMLLINSKIQSKKNGTNPSFLDLSHQVSYTVVEFDSEIIYILYH